MFTVAAAPLRIPKARTTGGGMRSCGWLILKFPKDLLPFVTHCFIHKASSIFLELAHRYTIRVEYSRVGLPLGLGSPVSV